MPNSTRRAPALDAISADTILSGFDSRLSTVETDLTAIRAEVQAGFSRVFGAIEDLRVGQAKSTSFPQVLQGALAMLGIVVILSGFVVWSIDSRTADMRAQNTSSRGLIESMTLKIHRLETELNERSARLANLEQTANNMSDWFDKRHDRANRYYEDAQLGRHDNRN